MLRDLVRGATTLATLAVVVGELLGAESHPVTMVVQPLVVLLATIDSRRLAPIPGWVRVLSLAAVVVGMTRLVRAVIPALLGGVLAGYGAAFAGALAAEMEVGVEAVVGVARAGVLGLALLGAVITVLTAGLVVAHVIVRARPRCDP